MINMGRVLSFLQERERGCEFAIIERGATGVCVSLWKGVCATVERGATVPGWLD